jgi:lipoprotein NlpI
MPEVFNYLGIYLTQAGNFDAAYEAFDSVLELDITAIYRIGAENRSDSKRYNLGRSFLLTLNLKTTNKYEKKYYYLNIWKKVKMFIVTKDFGNLFRLLLKVIKG